MERLLVINYKAYPQAFTDAGITIAKTARNLANRLSNTRIILAVPAPLTYKMSTIYEDIYLQHVDPLDYGSRTGYLPAKSLEHLPVKGTLVNHSEHKLVYREISYVVQTVKSIGKEVITCADTPGEAAGLAYLAPNAIAIEPPELIGTGIPVSKAKPEVITDSVTSVAKINPHLPVLAGAGITSGEDVRRAYQLGAKGVLVASAVMKAANPAEKLEELAVALDTA